MGHRLSRITTRTGDDGTTGLASGARVPKDSPRIEAIGAVDELNSHLGVLLAEALPDPVRICLERVQHDLFDLGGELGLPGQARITDAHTARLERELAELGGPLPPLAEFILPGGTRAAALCHVARAVCRRAERRLVALGRIEQVSPTSLRYVNRLSDLLFVAGRHINRHAGREEMMWQADRSRNGG